MPHREEAPGKTQDTLERLCLSAGLGTPRGPSGRVGGSVWGEGAEAGFNPTKVRRRERNIIGHRAILNVPGQRGGNITMCAAITQNGILHRRAGLGPDNTAHIIPFLDRLHNIVTAEQQMDAKQMRYIIVPDDVSFHRSALVQNCFHDHPQCSLQYLPPHSPFLNPIEEFFSAWWWKVYDLQPYVRTPLIHAMEEASDLTDAGSVQGRILHSRRFFPRCLMRGPESTLNNRSLTCPSRGERTLDHCYTTIKDDYKAQSHPPFGKSGHATIFLMAKYKQRLKQEVPAQREVACWTDQSVAALQDALDDADWDMFRRSSDDINMFMEVVVGFIGKLADDTVQKTTIRMFPNQKPWVDKTIHDALRSRTTAYNAGFASSDMDSYKAASHNARKAVKEEALWEETRVKAPTE
ncbi:hypothetical protein QTP70_012878 [Hemibagrus guttatus]|uniref:Tc1-like transposase DDE domain-containing protein n=1 Tax=Hemibagrus guttatus TaxID=175788 RepID=A0AAE0V755_9TELE|nr:hypothetical protein QTP70_012878 [Hemibagrus guttatus]